MEERRIPSLLLYIVFQQVQELMGEKSLAMLLRQGSLSDYLTTPPPADESPSITVQEYATLLAHIYEIFGPRHLYAGRAPRAGKISTARMIRSRLRPLHCCAKLHPGLGSNSRLTK